MALSANLAVADHNVPTTSRAEGIADPVSRLQVETLDKNAKSYGLTYFNMNDKRQGIVHVIGPEQGATLPGMTVVCGDSHTSTHGAFGALAHGIGTSEVEHVLATQTLLQRNPRPCWCRSTALPAGVTAKDIVLAIIGKIGTAGGTGYCIEFGGSAIRALSMEGRMTVCNMAIEAGARAGIIGVDDTTINYVKGRPFSPAGPHWDRPWPTGARCIPTRAPVRPGGHAERRRHQAAGHLGHLARNGAAGRRPRAGSGPRKRQRQAQRHRKALVYMDLKPNTPSKTSASTRCSSVPAPTRASKTCAPPPPWCAASSAPPTSSWRWWCRARAWSKQAEREGLDQIFKAAGFEWREPGCSMCLAMNADRLEPGERCASTSNRNFEGRQGQGGRTHLVSPAMAAAAGIAGHFVDVAHCTDLQSG
jgi:3-isopropylmalate/(R)-2-methylmalate dehydratase large subunit